MTSEPAGDEVPIPALMRSARGSYAQSIRASLAAEGISDIPRNGSMVLVSLASGEEPVAGMIRQFGVTKQAASQLIDTLVLRGYLTRDTDPADRRRVTIDLTDRGHAAAAAIYAGTVAIDAELAGMLSPAEMAGLRAGLAALGQIKERGKEAMIGPRTRLTEFSPIFGVKDLHQVLAHYESLGFATRAHAEGDEYGFAGRDRIGLHLAADPDHGPAAGAGAYLFVEDADALYAEWSRPGIGGITHRVKDTDYKLREGSHVDPTATSSDSARRPRPARLGRARAQLRLRRILRRQESPDEALGPGGMAAAELAGGQVSAPEITVIRNPGLDGAVGPGDGPQIP